LRLVRHQGSFQETQIPWDIEAGKLNPQDLEGIDAVVHLAGENIASGRWTEERKRRILDSRVKGTRLLAETLAKMENPPKVFVSASAVGYYG
ncbi:NAD-dependent epimerase/dehydratase family protein, partial [Salmonella enterica]|uniref:NAD-dependent epimerase/dehydratase family protein n=1 Tax=Salmonella enterica TaxID=28901 RepID=UPI003D271D38